MKKSMLIIFISSITIIFNNAIVTNASETSATYGEVLGSKGTFKMAIGSDDVLRKPARPRASIFDFRKSGKKMPKKWNIIKGSIEATSQGYQVTIDNYGTNRVNEIMIKIQLFTTSGKLLKTKTKALRNVALGKTTFTWDIEEQGAVEEIARVSGGLTNYGKTQRIISLTNAKRFNYKGVKYDVIKPLEGERDFMPLFDNILFGL